MPSLKRLPDAFSLQGCGQADGVAVPLKRKKPRSGDAFGTELFTPRRRERDARDSAGAPRPEGDRLSIGHNDTVLPPQAPKVATVQTFKVWKGASLGEFPGIPNHGYDPTGQQRPKAKRGKVLNFSESSRRNLQSALAKVRTDAELYTFCLSCPGFVEHLSHQQVKGAFLRFMKRLTAKAARDSRFRSAAGLWKQELQGRQVLHFHFLLAGVASSEVHQVHQWICAQWIECVLAIPGMPPEIVQEETRKMQAVHGFMGARGVLDRKSSLQLIVGNFHAYFAKYLGKDEKSRAADSPIPGRWWGKFNSSHIPTGTLFVIPSTDRVSVHAQRVARKIRQKRANAAKHRAVCGKWGFVRGEKGEPCISEFGLLGRRGTVFRSVVMMTYAPEDLEKWGGKVPRLGKYKFPPAMKFSSVRLIGSHVPEMMVRILQYAGERALGDRERTPF